MNFKTTIALVVLLVIGGAAVLFTRDSGPADDSNDSNNDLFGGTANEAKYVLDPQPEEDDLVRVVLERNNGQRLVFEREAKKDAATRAPDWKMVEPVNAPTESWRVGNLARMFAKVQHRGGFDVAVEDRTAQDFMFALQGPRAVEILNPLIDGCDIAELGYYRSTVVDFGGEPALLSRTGYTGEDGFEVICSTSNGAARWNRVIEAGTDCGLLPAGLGCRDTLRLEAAMPLYGHELNETTDPYTAGRCGAVKLDAADFIGKPAVAAKKADTNRNRRVGLQLETRRIAREGAMVFSGDKEIGRVTSGTFSPTLEQSIAMAYVTADHTAVGTAVEIDIRGKRHAARVVKLPFYNRG